MPTATLTRQAADQDAALAEGGPTLDQYDRRVAYQPTPKEETAVLLDRAAGSTVEQLFARYPHLDRQTVQRLADDPVLVRAAWQTAHPDDRDPAEEPDLAGPEEAPPDTPPEEPEGEPEIARALPEQITVTLPSSGPGVPPSTVLLRRLDYQEIRRLRGEGLSWAELKTRFKLPGQVLRAVAGDVDPHQAEKARAAVDPPARPAAASSPAPRVRADGKPRRRAATREENLTMARRIAAGESAVTVAAETGFAVSTVQATYRWAKREQLLDQGAGRDQ